MLQTTGASKSLDPVKDQFRVLGETATCISVYRAYILVQDQSRIEGYEFVAV